MADTAGATAARSNGGAQSGSSGQGQEIDIKSLSKDKIKQLLKSDPKFIGRLITQLDKQMHKMMEQKARRLEQIAVDQAEMDRLNETIRTHIQPHLDKLRANVKAKVELRDNLKKQLEIEIQKLKDLEREAAALIQRTRTSSTKVFRTTASQRLEEARGFSSTVPTSTLIRGKKA